MERMRIGRVVVWAVVVALAAPAVAFAHASLVRLRPADGAVLASAPGAVRVFFDDAIRPGPGVEAVRNGSGSVLAARAYVAKRNPRELVIPLRRGLGRGDFSVRWSVVSDDGHNERGVTAFAVGAGAARPTASLSAGGVGRTGDIAFRVLLFAGLLAAAGAGVFRLAVWPRELPERELSLLVFAGCVLAAAGAAGLAARGASGTRFDLVEWILAGVATGGAALALRWGRAAALVVLALVPLPALAGHALDASQPWWSAPADTVHLLGASVWIGGLLALAVALPRAARALEPMARGRVFAAATGRFSTLALASVVVLGGTGLARALRELSAVSQLWSTSYGRTLLVKTGLLACLVLLGARNRYRLVPRLRAATGRNPAGLRAFAGLRRSVVVELCLLAAVVGAVALLTELPPGRNARAAPPHASATKPPKLPPAGGVVLAREDGDRAVALSVRRSGGTLSLVATILSPNGFGFDGLPVGFAAGGRVATGASCGAGCYSASLAAPRARAVDVLVSGRRVRFPVYSGPSAAGLVIRAGRVFNSLRSLVYEESLASNPTNREVTRFEMVAPDRLAYRIKGGQQAVVVGGRRWDRSPGGRWIPSAQSPLHIPAAPWSIIRDARLIGRTPRLLRVAFLDPTVPAWFEITLQRRTMRTLDAHMTAAAHFMRDRYVRFNAPLRITPP
jgi:copper transport protein